MPMVITFDTQSIPLETYPNNGCIYTRGGSKDNRSNNDQQQTLGKLSIPAAQFIFTRWLDMVFFHVHKDITVIIIFHLS